MSRNDESPPPKKTRKLSSIQKATQARVTKKANNLARTHKALQARHNANSTCMQHARDCKQNKLQNSNQANIARQSSRAKQRADTKNQCSKHAKKVINHLNDINKLIGTLNDKLDALLLHKNIDVNLLYVIYESCMLPNMS